MGRLTKSRAIFSEVSYSKCKKHRYHLLRILEEGNLECVNFLMLNPSRANKKFNDPTINRCELFAMKWGYGQYSVTNLFSYMTPSPTDLKKAKSPLKDENDHELIKQALRASIIICAWGDHGTHMDRHKEVTDLLKPFSKKLYYLKMNKTNQPAHPGRLSNSLLPKKWTQ